MLGIFCEHVPDVFDLLKKVGLICVRQDAVSFDLFQFSVQFNKILCDVVE